MELIVAYCQNEVANVGYSYIVLQLEKGCSSSWGGSAFYMTCNDRVKSTSILKILIHFVFHTKRISEFTLRWILVGSFVVYLGPMEGGSHIDFQRDY